MNCIVIAAQFAKCDSFQCFDLNSPGILDIMASVRAQIPYVPLIIQINLRSSPSHKPENGDCNSDANCKVRSSVAAILHRICNEFAKNCNEFAANCNELQNAMNLQRITTNCSESQRSSSFCFWQAILLW